NKNKHSHMKNLPENYDSSEAEKRLQKAWLDTSVYRWENTLPREQTYVIDTPPPTVSGMLHMGHVFSYTQADFIARYQRMAGKTVFYPMGFDDNGLPTERLVEKTKKVRATDMSREDFIKLCESVGEESRAEFRELFQSLALSVDWQQEYHTVSASSRRISQMSFLDLAKKGEVYRKLQPMLWDPVDQTAIAQAEVEDKEFPSSFNDIAFAVEGSDEKLVIATTRPEMIPACVAIFYHPDDARYAHLKGKTAITPLFGIRVPILTDEAVEPEKGTGIMMCCTFGDEADIEKWRKHNLEIRLILNKYGKLTGIEGEHGEVLNNLKATVAREKILELLKASGDLLESKPIVHSVKCAERSGAPLEILPTYQWFVKVLDHKDALKAKAAKAEWHPPHMKVRMDQWIDGLSWDWCISRQRYFGVPFPVWYSKRAGEEGKILFADKSQLPVNPLVDLPAGYTRDEVEPEADVMDTWATSSVSPQLSSHAINAEFADDHARHEQLFPADLRPQAHEIIRTWAFYTLVKSHLHEDSLPWKNLMISGWCLAADKSKMSKSKGNTVTPTDLLATKGADVVRYWASTSKLGADTAFSEDVLKIGRKLVNKLWNATKFVATHLAHLKSTPATAAAEVESGIISEVLDRWILTRLNRAIEKATKEFEAYEYSDARVAVEDFFWNDFCDNYLELVKSRVYGNEVDEAARMSAVHTIYHCLDGILRLFAPFVPHVTDELFSYVFDDKHQAAGSIHARGTWPRAADYPRDETAEKAGKDCLVLLEAVRKQKSERNISIKFPIEEVAISVQESYDLEDILKATFGDLKGASNAANIHLGVMQGNEPSRTVTATSEDGRFNLSVLFAAQSEVA
ncbi:MAG: valine--tRNA ligase, partial [Alphaproteobacteria bacterium]|nr:valine--tRNA ligase [Alphaproteobacteria bacterium]